MDSYTCSAIRVRHSEPLLVVPAEPTPNEIKHVSDIDDQEGLRMHLSLIMFYKSNRSMKLEADPAKVIVRAISMALVHYYPLAGRLREGPNRKLMVDCNGEGVLFIEAEADIALDQLGHSIGPPSPHWKQFLRHVPGSEGILGCPLLLIQVNNQNLTCL